MSVTNDYEIEFDGSMIADGDTRTILTFDVFTSPELRVGDQPRGLEDGMFPGPNFYGERTITLELELMAEDDATFYNTYQLVLAACRKTQDERRLEFKLPGWPDNLVSNCRVRRVSGLIVDQRFDIAKSSVLVQFVATDPRLYAANGSSAIVDLESEQSGRTYDLEFDRVYGGVVSSNIINATNLGNYDAPWEARIDGPVTNPTIEHVDSGKTLRLNATINDGEHVIVSSAPYRTIMLGGTASRYYWLDDATQWFMLEPGNNQVRFGGSSAGTPQLTFSWSSAWV